MWKHLYRTFYYQTYFYEVNAPIGKVIERLDDLFADKGWLSSPNMKGEFVDYPETFIIKPKRSYFSQNQDQAVLKGVLTKLSETKTQIEISVKPNALFGLMAVFFVIGGLYMLCRCIIEEMPVQQVLGAFGMMVVPAPVFFVVARNVSGGLREDFEKYMDVDSNVTMQRGF